MSAAATAAGYLYASGRLRGRGARDQEESGKAKSAARPEQKREVRVAALPGAEPAPKRTPRIQYRVRRWKPEQATND